MIGYRPVVGPEVYNSPATSPTNTAAAPTWYPLTDRLIAAPLVEVEGFVWLVEGEVAVVEPVEFWQVTEDGTEVREEESVKSAH